MTWRIAKSLDKLRSQVNAAWPKRNKSSDGTIGDEAHASRSSDHNQWVKDGKTGVVTGMDITNDPDKGPVSNDIAKALRASRDPRIKYIISNAQICSGSGGTLPWVWRKYSGSNAHRKHVHLSVKAEKSLYDSVEPWKIVEKFAEPVAKVYDNANDDQPATPPAINPVVVDADVQGDPDTYSIQSRLKAMNYNPGIVDGVWGGNTAGAISGFINDRHLTVSAPTSIDEFNTARESLKVELGRAETESFKRPVSDERKSGNAAVVAAVAPEVVPVKQNFLLTAWGAVATFFAAIWNALSDHVSAAWNFFTEHKDSVPTDSGFLKTVWGYATSVPTTVWIVLGGVGLVFVAINSARAVNEIKQSVQTGARQ